MISYCTPFSIASHQGIDYIWRNGERVRPATPEERELMRLLCEPRPDDSEAWRLVMRLRDGLAEVYRNGNGRGEETPIMKGENDERERLVK